MTIIESRTISFDEALADLIDAALEEGEPAEEVMSALEAQLMALEEETKADG